MSHDFDTTLDECLALLRAGADWKTCLARYPQYAPKLESLLKLASNVQKAVLPTPTRAAHKAGQRRMLDVLAQKRPGRFMSSSLWVREHNVFAHQMLRSFAQRRILAACRRGTNNGPSASETRSLVNALRSLRARGISAANPRDVESESRGESE